MCLFYNLIDYNTDYIVKASIFSYFYHIFYFSSYLLIRQIGFMEGYMYSKKILFFISCIILICFCFNYSYATTPSSYIWSDTSNIDLLETVLYQHNAHDTFRPASVTKVMSLLLIMEAIDNRRNFSY